MKLLCLVILLLLTSAGFAQEVDKWDNQLYLINKIGWGKNHWRYTGELQGRFNENASDLQQYHIEFAATYMPSKYWDIVPDFRYVVKPHVIIYRPGFGILYKHIFPKGQLAHQLKWQWDKESTGYSSQSVRYGLFYNHNLGEHFMGFIFGGGMYEVGEEFTDWWGFRLGSSVAYLVDMVHMVSLGYMYGAVNLGDVYTHIGIVTVGLIINIRREYKYMPARYLSF